MLRFETNWPIGGLGQYRNIHKNSGIPEEEEMLESYLNITGFDKLSKGTYCASKL